MQHVPLTRKRGRLMKDGHVVTKNVIDIPSSDDEQGEPLSQKKMTQRPRNGSLW